MMQQQAPISHLDFSDVHIVTNYSPNGISTLPPSLQVPSSNNDVSSISVCVRVRPFLSVEQSATSNSAPVWYIDDQHHTLTSENDLGTRQFTFDRVLAPTCSNADVYSAVASRIVNATLRGINGTVLAYGQTGSGKTHSMLGEDRNDPGILFRAIDDIFSYINADTAAAAAEGRSVEWLVRLSYIEVYQEEVNDLLQPRGRGRALKILGDDAIRGAVIEGLVEEIVINAEQAADAIARGEANRHYGSTALNTGSSRSHTVFRMVLENKQGDILKQGISNTEDTGTTHVSYLNLVDLAGSERQEFTQATGERLREGSSINKSLSSLALVISKLADASRRGDSLNSVSRRTASTPRDMSPAHHATSSAISPVTDHIPYRNSKLTRILRQSLGGNALTAVLCTISPTLESRDESISTLKFATTCKSVQIRAVANVAVADKTLLRQYRARIAELQAAVEAEATSRANAMAQAEAALGLLFALDPAPTLKEEMDITDDEVEDDETFEENMQVHGEKTPHRRSRLVRALRAASSAGIDQRVLDFFSALLTSRDEQLREAHDVAAAAAAVAGNDAIDVSKADARLAEALQEAEAAKERAERLSKTVERLQSLIIGSSNVHTDTSNGSETHVKDQINELQSTKKGIVRFGQTPRRASESALLKSQQLVTPIPIEKMNINNESVTKALSTLEELMSKQNVFSSNSKKYSVENGRLVMDSSPSISKTDIDNEVSAALAAVRAGRNAEANRQLEMRRSTPNNSNVPKTTASRGNSAVGAEAGEIVSAIVSALSGTCDLQSVLQVIAKVARIRAETHAVELEEAVERGKAIGVEEGSAKYIEEINRLRADLADAGFLRLTAEEAAAAARAEAAQAVETVKQLMDELRGRQTEEDSSVATMSPSTHTKRLDALREREAAVEEREAAIRAESLSLVARGHTADARDAALATYAAELAKAEETLGTRVVDLEKANNAALEELREREIAVARKEAALASAEANARVIIDEAKEAETIRARESEALKKHVAALDARAQRIEDAEQAAIRSLQKAAEVDTQLTQRKIALDEKEKDLIEREKVLEGLNEVLAAAATAREAVSHDQQIVTEKLQAIESQLQEIERTRTETNEAKQAAFAQLDELNADRTVISAQRSALLFEKDELENRFAELKQAEEIFERSKLEFEMEREEFNLLKEEIISSKEEVELLRSTLVQEQLRLNSVAANLQEDKRNWENQVENFKRDTIQAATTVNTATTDVNQYSELVKDEQTPAKIENIDTIHALEQAERVTLALNNHKNMFSAILAAEEAEVEECGIEKVSLLDDHDISLIKEVTSTIDSLKNTPTVTANTTTEIISSPLKEHSIQTNAYENNSVNVPSSVPRKRKESLQDEQMNIVSSVSSQVSPAGPISRASRHPAATAAPEFEPAVPHLSPRMNAAATSVLDNALAVAKTRLWADSVGLVTEDERVQQHTTTTSYINNFNTTTTNILSRTIENIPSSITLPLEKPPRAGRSLFRPLEMSTIGLQNIDISDPDSSNFDQSTPTEYMTSSNAIVNGTNNISNHADFMNSASILLSSQNYMTTSSYPRATLVVPVATIDM